MPNPNLTLIFDFDGTLTKRDTMTALGNHVGYACNNPKNLPPWSHFYNAYLSHKKALTEFYADSPHRSKLENAIEYQHRMRPVEEASFNRVMDAGVFEGVTQKDVEKGAWVALESGDVELREGAVELLNAAVNRQSEGTLQVSIVSVNWSAEWIRQVLAAAGVEGTIDVRANELPSLGGKWPNITTSDQKLQVMQECCKGREDSLKVYIGDSITDLECLLAADVGILIRDEPMRSGQQEISDLLAACDLSVRPLDDYSTMAGDRALQFANDFSSVSKWLSRHSLMSGGAT